MAVSPTIHSSRLAGLLCIGNNRISGIQISLLTCSQVVYVLRCLCMGKPDSLLGSLDLLVLKILSRRPKLHGYALMIAIKETSGDMLSAEEGSLYPALHRMEDAGWIRAEWVVKENGKRARNYQLTAMGKKQLAVEETRWQTVSSAINRVLREA